MRAFIVVCFLLVVLKTEVFADYVRGCYFADWGMYRPDKGKHTPKDIPANLCTHIFYAFVAMGSDFTLNAFDPWADLQVDGAGQYKEITDLKNIQPTLKVLLSFGGWTFSQNSATLLQTMASSEQNRKVFVQSAVKFLHQYNFDGLDIDWEYPTSQTKASYAALMQDLRTAFDAASPKLLLSAAVSAGMSTIDAGYDVPTLATAFDMLNIMSYDMELAGTTSFNAPLYDRNSNGLSVKSAAEYWASKGFPKNKINVGLANYGRGYTLSDPSNSGVGAAGTPSPAQTYSQEAGMAFYYEICGMLNNGATRVWDDTQQVPYLVLGNLWMGYDDPQSFTSKLQWVQQNGYGGAFVWTLHEDDFSGSTCQGGTPYPLTSKMNDILGSGSLIVPVVNPVVPIVVSTPSNNIVPVVNGSFSCPGAGQYPDPQGCSTYYVCDSSNNANLMTCPAGLNYNKNTSNCDWPSNVTC